MKSIIFIWLSLLAMAAAQSDLSMVPADLTVPALTSGKPGPGKRVAQTTLGWEATKVHHLLYLPTDWSPGANLPVIVEYAGNGNYRNKYGDTSDGTVEGSRLGYGISGGKGFIWICMPYVQVQKGAKTNAPLWWGDIQETKRYCLATVRDVCGRFGGDSERIILCGFSRGSIGCNFIGLHDDEIARLWRAFVCHSHYDGVIEKWPYPGADRASALTRLKRLNGRPQFISHEGSTAATETYLKATGISGDFTFVPIPFRNHSDAWVLRDLPERRKLRDWLARIING
ncbi:MAG TPA: hypothetical protein VD994_14385 [Prosthecobacter sp.]|nr:hypothetical protein [Prosthecobacter sp.]